MNRRARLKVTGLVQGVFYRASTETQARTLGLTGWVRNCVDGSVEVVAEGSEADLRSLESWCQRGPAGARVSVVELEWLPASGEFVGFEIRH